MHLQLHLKEFRFRLVLASVVPDFLLRSGVEWSVCTTVLWDGQNLYNSDWEFLNNIKSKVYNNIKKRR